MQINEVRRPWAKKPYSGRKNPDPFYHTQEWRRIRNTFLSIYRYCIKCGEPATIADHIIQRCKGGADTFDNLQPLCKSCHQVKSSKEGKLAQMESKRNT